MLIHKGIEAKNLSEPTGNYLCLSPAMRNEDVFMFALCQIS